MITNRLLDIMVSLILLVVLFPLVAIFAILIKLQDGGSILYTSTRIGKSGKPFEMYKLRSMIVGADQSGVDSTAADDCRITPLGRLIRNTKIDEIPQLVNVLIGDMTLVGPRPNVPRETDNYTAEEQKLLSIKPGITDIASLVFSDLSEILRSSPNPDLHYNQFVRPWKSRIGLFYVDNRSAPLDMSLLLLTGLSPFISRHMVLRIVCRILVAYGADQLLVQVASRKCPLEAVPPPGATALVTDRRV